MRKPIVRAAAISIAVLCLLLLFVPLAGAATDDPIERDSIPESAVRVDSLPYPCYTHVTTRVQDVVSSPTYYLLPPFIGVYWIADGTVNFAWCQLGDIGGVSQ